MFIVFVATILTAIIPVGDGLTTESIKGASVTAYITQKFPKFKLGNKVFMAGTRSEYLSY